MKHILLVDDNLTNLKQAASLLKDHYKVSMVKSGEQALEFLEKYNPDLILMDVEMPEMDGYETTRRIKQNPKTSRIPVIFLTGDQDVNSEIKGFEVGAVDYVRKPFTKEIMMYRVGLHLELFEYQQNLERILEEKTKELMENLIQSDRMKTELELAGKLQAQMVPEDLPERNEFKLYAKMKSAKEVCGDLYDYFIYDNRYLVIAIGDASGKGIGAALFMTQARTLFSHVLNDVLMDGKPLEEAFYIANNELCKDNKENLFLTLFVSILDLQTGEMTCCNAAHNPPLMTVGNRDFEYLECKQNFILGGVKDMKYETTKLQLKPGTRFLFYTDGITESNNAEYELFGEERLLELVNRLSRTASSMEEATESLFHEVEEYAKGIPQADDITLLFLLYKGPAC